MLQISKHCAILFALLVLVSCFDQSLTAESACADWASYKDEKCFKVIEDATKTYDEAEKACAKLENSPTLAIIHSQEEQNFLVNYLFKTLKKVDNVWVGAKFLSNAFHWVDNSSLTFTNWDAKGVHNKSNYCVELLSDELTLGKWTDGPCERKNAFVCQKAQTWTMARLQETLLETRKQLTDALDVANKKLDEANKKIGSLEKNLSEQKQNSIPIGFIYTQLPNEKPPASIWPSMNWADISSTYAGVFFRVNGNRSETFGQIQEENAPRLIKIEKLFTDEGTTNLFEVNTFSESPRTSNVMITGSSSSTAGYRSMRFTISGGEVRPRNMAIRMWKRTR